MDLRPIPDEKKVIEFLREALQHGWPSNVVPTTKADLPGFEEIHYDRNPWRYVDLYGGAQTDIGFELIFHKSDMVWGTTYRGGFIDNESTDTTADRVFGFLVRALRAPNDLAVPLRGPSELESEDCAWLYKYRMSGSFASFAAVERILLNGEIVYERVFSGGYFGDEAVYGKPVPVFATLFS